MVAAGTRGSRLTAALTWGLILALAALPAVASRAQLQDLFFVFTMLILAELWNLLAGYAGLLSVGQQAFVGLGGYALFGSTLLAGLDPVLAVGLSGLLAGMVAIPTAFVVFRLRGAYFAIGTWVVAETFRLLLAQVKPLAAAPEPRFPLGSAGAWSGSIWSARCLGFAAPRLAT